jgi:hypothetical protein
MRALLLKFGFTSLRRAAAAGSSAAQAGRSQTWRLALRAEMFRQIIEPDFVRLATSTPSNSLAG